MKAINMFLIIAVLSILTLSILNIAKVNSITASTTPKEYAEIVIKVVDSKTFMPIENAQLIIIETKTKHSTNKQGYSESISVPVLKNHNFDSSKPCDFGEVTILAKASGYADHIMFFVKVKPKQKRVGIIIPLQQIINKEDNQTTITLEEPDTTWVQELIRQF